MCVIMFSPIYIIYIAFSLGLYERMRGTYLDVDKCVLEWNHENEAQVGVPSVVTIKVSTNRQLYLWQSKKIHLQVVWLELRINGLSRA